MDNWVVSNSGYGNSAAMNIRVSDIVFMLRELSAVSELLIILHWMQKLRGPYLIDFKNKIFTDENKATNQSQT